MQILTAIEELKILVNGVISTQKQILRYIQIGGVAVGTDDLPDDINLPLDDMDSVEELERRLEDHVVERCLVSNDSSNFERIWLLVRAKQIS